MGVRDSNKRIFRRKRNLYIDISRYNDILSYVFASDKPFLWYKTPEEDQEII